MKKIGVLALQGSVVEHINKLQKIKNVKPIEVRSEKDLASVDGIILPGGESTTIGKLLNEYNLNEGLKSRIKRGMPVWGTCAGMILLAKEIVDQDPYLAVMDIKVRRNAYGRQIDSFNKSLIIPEISKNTLDLIFIRAPWIEEIKENVTSLLNLDDAIVAARQENMLVTSFHPELTDNLDVHQYFADMC